MKKILFIIILLLIPISVYAKEDYKIIADIDLEVGAYNYTLNCQKFDNSLTFKSKNKFYKVDTVTGENKSIDLGKEINWWNAYDSKEMKLNNTPEKFIVFTKGNTSDENDNAIIYLLDSNLNILNQQNLEIDELWSIYIVKDKLMIYYITNDSDYNQILNIKVYNKDLSLFKTIVKEDKVDYYDFSTYKFNNRADWYGDLDDLSYYYTFDDNYDIVKKNYKTRVILNKTNKSKIELYDFEQDKAIKTIDLSTEPNFQADINQLKDYNNKIYISTQLNVENECYVNIYDNDLNMIKTRKFNTLLSDSPTFNGPTINNPTYFSLNFSEAGDRYWHSRSYYLDENLNDLEYIPYNTQRRDLFYNDDKLFEIGYNLLHRNEDKKLVYAAQKIGEKFYYLCANFDTPELELNIYNENGTLYKKKKVSDLTYASNYSTGNIVLMNDKILVDFTNIYKDEDELLEPIHKVYDLDGNELEYDTSDIYEDYKVTFAGIEDGDEKMFSLMEQIDDDEALYTNNIKVVKLLRKANIESMNGDVTLDTDELYQGKEVTLNIKPKSGYKVKSITVKDKDGNIIEVKDNKFIYPDGDITIDVEYETSVNPNTIDKILGFLMFDIVSVISLLLLLFIYRKRKVY